MKKIPSLFKRHWTGDRQVYNEIVPGSEWVLKGGGLATVKWDGTACMIKDNILYKRYSRRLTPKGKRLLKTSQSYIPKESDFKPAPDNWIMSEPKPDRHTASWPGWVLVDENDPSDKWHREAFKKLMRDGQRKSILNGTYELIGPKVQGNPYNDQIYHVLIYHNEALPMLIGAPRNFHAIKTYLEINDQFEGIVWHHPDGRMVKIKRRDFGLEWPIKEQE